MVEHTRAWMCDVCSQPVSRILGLAGIVILPNGAVSTRAVARGYCRAHRERVRQTWVGELESSGSVEWIGEPPADLRPRDVEEFLMFTDRRFSLVGEGVVSASGDTACPHCRSAVKFGAGPHFNDAALRPGAESWVCPGCGAAGLAYSAN